MPEEPANVNTISRRLCEMKLNSKRLEVELLVRALVEYRELLIVWEEPDGQSLRVWSKSTQHMRTYV